MESAVIEREREGASLKHLTKSKSKNAGCNSSMHPQTALEARACTETSSCQCDRMPLSAKGGGGGGGDGDGGGGRAEETGTRIYARIPMRTRTHSKKARKFRRRIDRLINSVDPEALIRHRRNIASSPRRKTNIRNATPAAA